MSSEAAGHPSCASWCEGRNGRPVVRTLCGIANPTLEDGVWVPAGDRLAVLRSALAYRHADAGEATPTGDRTSSKLTSTLGSGRCSGH